MDGESEMPQKLLKLPSLARFRDLISPERETHVNRAEEKMSEDGGLLQSGA